MTPQRDSAGCLWRSWFSTTKCHYVHCVKVQQLVGHDFTFLYIQPLNFTATKSIYNTCQTRFLHIGSHQQASSLRTLTHIQFASYNPQPKLFPHHHSNIILPKKCNLNHPIIPRTEYKIIIFSSQTHITTRCTLINRVKG